MEVLKCRERGERRGKSLLSAEGVTRVPRRLEGGEDAREGGSLGEPGVGDRARGAGGAGLRAGGNLDLNRASAGDACPLQALEGRPQLSLPRQIGQIRFGGCHAKKFRNGEPRKLFCLNRWEVMYRFLFYCYLTFECFIDKHCPPCLVCVNS